MTTAPDGSVTLTGDEWVRLQTRIKRSEIAVFALKQKLHGILNELEKVLLYAMPRASGKAECESCGLAYDEHPEFPFPTANVLCDGSTVKT